MSGAHERSECQPDRAKPSSNASPTRSASAIARSLKARSVKEGRSHQEMKAILHFVLIISLVAAVGGCAAESSDSDAKAVLKNTIPSGTRIRIALIDGVSTVKSSPGDQFLASLAEPVIVEGKMVLEKGSKVRGRVVDVQESGKVKGRASIRLILTEILRDSGNVPISTKPFTAVAEDTKKRDAAIIAGGAGVGAAVGAIAGGKKGAGIGALVGGGAGTGTVLATKGKEIVYPSETRLSFTLSSPLEI